MSAIILQAVLIMAEYNLWRATTVNYCEPKLPKATSGRISRQSDKLYPVEVASKSKVYTVKTAIYVPITVATVIEMQQVSCVPRNGCMYMYSNSMWSTTMHGVEYAILKSIDTETRVKTIRCILATCIVIC